MSASSQAHKVRLVVTRSGNYSGRVLRSGDEITVPETDAADLIAARFARRATGTMGRRAGKYLRRDIRAKE